MEQKLIFKNYMERCSALGNIMTSLPVPITTEEEDELDNLVTEKRTGINANGNKTKWTDIKEARVKSLVKKKKAEDELPTGAKTHLDSVFRDIFWSRKEILANKYLDKGLLTEQDILRLISKADDTYYEKNGEHDNTGFIQGAWDNYDEKVRDTKSSYSLKTFDEAEMTPGYKWQLKGYSWIIKEREKLDYFPEGELVYGLVNNPLHHITNEFTKQYYANGCPDENDERWLEIKRQIERNMIFDIALFKRDSPKHFMENKVWNFDIPKELRLKIFPVITTQDDVDHMKRRVMMSRVYLCEKEVAIYKKLNKG